MASRTRLVANAMAKVIESKLTELMGSGRMGYILVLHPMGDNPDKAVAYNSNIERRDAIKVLNELVKEVRKSMARPVSRILH